MEMVGLVLVLGLEQASATISTNARVKLGQYKQCRTNFQNVMANVFEEEEEEGSEYEKGKVQTQWNFTRDKYTLNNYSTYTHSYTLIVVFMISDPQ